MQSLINTLRIVYFVFPVLVVVFFVYFLSRNPRNFKNTENIIGFLCLLFLLTIVPFLTYVAEVLKHGKGFIGYYALIPSTVIRIYSSGKTALFLFLIYLLSIHALGSIPFLAIFKIVLLKNRLAGTKFAIDDNETVKELGKLAGEIKAVRGIRNDVEVRVVDVGSGSGCEIMRKGAKAVLVINRNFLESFSKGRITKEDARAVFHHEFSHLINKDYLIPVASKAILNRAFVFMIYFSFSFYVGIMSRYDFFNENLLRPSFMSAYPIILALIPLFFAFCIMLGFCLWALSLFLRRCEMLADNLAIQHVPRKSLIDALAKMSVISETAGLLAMPFYSQPEFGKKKRTLIEDIVYALKTMNVFSSYNKIYLHPGISERIELLNNPQKIIEEENIGILRFDVFSSIGVLIMFFSGISLAVSELLVGNVNWRDVNLVSASFVMYLVLVFLACLPLQYSNKQFVYDANGIKMVLIYSLFISAFSNTGIIMKNVTLMFQDFSGKPDWIVGMFIKSQFSRIADLFLKGFFLAVFLFVVFITIGNFIVRIRNRKERVAA